MNLLSAIAAIVDGWGEEQWRTFFQLLFAAGSIVVALVAVHFSYRSNNGWPPVILVLGHGVSRDTERAGTSASIRFEVWNRRKYPVVLRQMTIEFANLPILDGLEEWRTFQGEAFWSETKSIDPNKPEAFNARMYVEKLEGKLQKSPYAISISVFDPVKNKIVTIEARGQFMNFARTGWWHRFFRRPKLRRRWKAE